MQTGQICELCFVVVELSKQDKSITTLLDFLYSGKCHKHQPVRISKFRYASKAHCSLKCKTSGRQLPDASSMQETLFHAKACRCHGDLRVGIIIWSKLGKRGSAP